MPGTRQESRPRTTVLHLAGRPQMSTRQAKWKSARSPKAYFEREQYLHSVILRNRGFVRYLILARHSFNLSRSERTCESMTLCSAAMPLLENSAEAFLSRFCCQSRIATFVALWAVDVALTYVCMQASVSEHDLHS